MPGTQTNFSWLYTLLSILAVCVINDRTILLTFKSVSKSFNWNVFFSSLLLIPHLLKPFWVNQIDYRTFHPLMTYRLLTISYSWFFLCGSVSSWFYSWLLIFTAEAVTNPVTKWMVKLCPGTLFRFTRLLWSFLFSRHDCPRIVSAHAPEDS